MQISRLRPDRTQAAMTEYMKHHQVLKGLVTVRAINAAHDLST